MAECGKEPIKGQPGWRTCFVCGGLWSEELMGKDWLPRRIQPISVTQIEFFPDKDKTLKPQQKVGDEEISLDLPTFFYQQLNEYDIG